MDVHKTGGAGGSGDRIDSVCVCVSVQRILLEGIRPGPESPGRLVRFDRRSGAELERARQGMAREPPVFMKRITLELFTVGSGCV